MESMAGSMEIALHQGEPSKLRNGRGGSSEVGEGEVRRQNPHGMMYRADLDGLRAIAVLSVIAFHLSPALLSGGYLGVDIFFVLSGYLITAIIWRDSVRHQFTMAGFYQRRLRRIMPALMFLLITVSVCAVALLLPIDLIGYATSALASIGFSTNLYFWRDTNYFSQAAGEKPLLHLWSLGIEEQFYFIYPVLMIFCIRLRKSWLLPVTSTLVALSMFADAALGKSGAFGAAFYLLPTRAWELGAGSLLALAPRVTLERSWIRQMLGVVAALSLAISLYKRDEWVTGLTLTAVLTVCGAALIIFLGSAGGSWLNRLLSAKELVGIGLISYSLYLWHWPVLVFMRYYMVRQVLSVGQVFAALLLVFALATLSWRYVERPFRNPSVPVRSVLLWVAGGYCFVAATAIAALVWHGFPSRFSAPVARINSAVGSHYRCNLTDYFSFGALHACPLSLPSGDPRDATVALVGNSHAQMYAPLVSDYLRAHGEKGILVPLNSCLPLPDVNLSEECMAQAATNLAAVEGLPGIRVVIVAMYWERPKVAAIGDIPKGQETAYLIAGVDRLIASLQEHGKLVVLVGPLATPESDVTSMAARELAFRGRIDEPMFLPESTFMAKEQSVLKHYEARTDLVFIRPDLIQCRLAHCDFFRDGEALFSDSNHLASGALPQFRSLFVTGLDKVLGQSEQGQNGTYLRQQ